MDNCTAGRSGEGEVKLVKTGQAGVCYSHYTNYMLTLFCSTVVHTQGLALTALEIGFLSMVSLALVYWLLLKWFCKTHCIGKYHIVICIWWDLFCWKTYSECILFCWYIGLNTLTKTQLLWKSWRMAPSPLNSADNTFNNNRINSISLHWIGNINCFTNKNQCWFFVS